MNHLTPADLVSIQTFVTYLIVYSALIGLALGAFVSKVFRKIRRSINAPNRIKTEVGYLYREDNGLYVTKERHKELLIQRELKNKQRAIRRHTYILERLESAD